jgi:hypothetical protein
MVMREQIPRRCFAQMTLVDIAIASSIAQKFQPF